MSSRLALRGAALVAAALAVTSCSSGSGEDSSAEGGAPTSSASGAFPVTVSTGFGDVTVDEEPTRVVADRKSVV